ncbi:Zn-dependet alcohol dehydrogenase [Desulforapulum autotrophicum HRM2]|uniref:Zn-dependet alcohol dehydrogenase n=1 Tax=Desulforapulum autotrophicum (strain ATCC 43914 / DSM 3382 / VKM B-1955 / HRM2) TaxID=177437 RepID=C0QM54_DESAH|nr:YhdH/YhfP family quinone oxidoreductase [Desulforapulum autotrophicum]ACN14360.1 Zn-dependet alcohol dehydrogenase [Desulforapulum autotrophicum HRM2]
MNQAMNQAEYKALVVEELSPRAFTRTVKTKSIDTLPPGDLLIRVSYSSLNYKDALSASGNRGVTRTFPHTPGIDATGVVMESATQEFKQGDEVIVTSYDLGMNTPGGFGQYIRVPAQWAVKLPPGLTQKESMIFGTAGFTAGMSVAHITKTLTPSMGEILVTGATGGVGSLSVAILAKLGFEVVGVTGKKTGSDFLKSLGAKRTITREEAMDTSGRPLLKAQWAGAIDTVGGEILATAIKSTNSWGVVTCCGNVASPDLAINVFPFILRGVTLAGIDSQNCPMPLRESIWKKLAGDWKFNSLDTLHKEVTLAGLEREIILILAGKQQGRVLVNLSENR